MMPGNLPEQLNKPIPKRPAKAKTGTLHVGAAEESNQTGRELQPHAAKVLMKFCTARA